MSAPAPGASAATAEPSCRPETARPGAAFEPPTHPSHLRADLHPAPATATSAGAAAAESKSLSPAARLYRHALESIFAFLGLRGVAAALRVSRGWMAAVQSMASLGLPVAKPSAPICEVAASPMSRHVASLGSQLARLPLTADSLFVLARHMAHLRELHVDLQPTRPPPTWSLQQFPCGLRKLRLQLAALSATADVNGVFRAAGRLPLLEALTVHLPTVNGEVSFAQLSSAPLLRDLQIHIPRRGPELSDAQVDELRAMPLMRGLHVDPTSTALLRRLLRQPHELQWQFIALPHPLDDAAAALLPQLPSLTDFIGWTTCSRFDFLRGLPNLVDVFLTESPPYAGTIESLVNHLQRCDQITDLPLARFADLTTAHLSELLPRLPRLHDLSLAFLDIASLAFLGHESVTRSLRSLQLHYCERLPLTELQHVHALHSLKDLSVVCSFTTSLDAHGQSLYTPPSALLPQLESFYYSPP